MWIHGHVGACLSIISGVFRLQGADHVDVVWTQHLLKNWHCMGCVLVDSNLILYNGHRWPWASSLTIWKSPWCFSYRLICVWIDHGCNHSVKIDSCWVRLCRLVIGSRCISVTDRTIDDWFSEDEHTIRARILHKSSLESAPCCAIRDESGGAACSPAEPREEFAVSFPSIWHPTSLTSVLSSTGPVLLE